MLRTFLVSLSFPRPPPSVQSGASAWTAPSRVSSARIIVQTGCRVLKTLRGPTTLRGEGCVASMCVLCANRCYGKETKTNVVPRVVARRCFLDMQKSPLRTIAGIQEYRRRPPSRGDAALRSDPSGLSGAHSQAPWHTCAVAPMSSANAGPLAASAKGRERGEGRKKWRPA